MSLKPCFALISLLALTFFAREVAARTFVAAAIYPSGELPSAAVVADFNGDHIPDIISANTNDSDLSLFLGTPKGKFGPPTTFSLGGTIAAIETADLNGDGKPDLVVTDGGSSVRIALGNGDGTFAPATAIHLHPGPRGIEIKDLNGDGKLDLAIAIAGPEFGASGEVAILLGKGDGTFHSRTYFPLQHRGAAVRAADLNNDGKLDLVLAVQHFPEQLRSLAVLMGNGDGTFGPVVLAVPGGANNIAVADLNRDGNVDVVLASADFDPTVKVLLGRGDGRFQRPVSYATDGPADQVTLADTNRDGRLDIVVGGGQVNVLRGHGDGTFAPTVSSAVGQRFATLGFFDGDDIPDVVAGGGFSQIGVAFGNGNGTFRAAQVYLSGDSLLASADLNGDGFTDVVTGNTLLLGDGAGGFTPGVPFTTAAVEFAEAGDFDGDHRTDILVTRSDAPGVLVFSGNGDGTFQPAKATNVGSGTDLWPETADFDHDGTLDLALAHTNSGRLTVHRGNGDGTFQTGVEYLTGGVPQSPISADFNNDGNIDLAVSSNSTGIAIFLGNGDGTFTEAPKIDAPGALYSATTDFNGDGNADIVVAVSGTVVFLGNGDGTFQPGRTILGLTGPLAVADVDGDGSPDVAVSADFFTFTLLRGNGDGTFKEPETYDTGFLFVGDLLLADLNGDGLPEAIVNNIGGAQSVLRNSSRVR